MYDEEPKFKIGDRVKLLDSDGEGVVTHYDSMFGYYTLEVDPVEFFFSELKITEAYLEPVAATPIAIEQRRRCTCGAEAVNGPAHSRWCDLTERAPK